MTFQERLNNNRALLGIPDPEPLPLAHLTPLQIADILTTTIALIDAVELLQRQSLEVELCGVKQLATAVENTIAQAVLTARPHTLPID